MLLLQYCISCCLVPINLLETRDYFTTLLLSHYIRLVKLLVAHTTQNPPPFFEAFLRIEKIGVDRERTDRHLDVTATASPPPGPFDATSDAKGSRQWRRADSGVDR
jgi:hypothetical protein